MQYYTATATDGCPLAFQSSLPIPPIAITSANAGSQNSPGYDRCVVLMHGFSGSSDYFTRNFAALAKHHWVIAPDMRGHGRSGRRTGGYHVARLAADLRSILQFLTQQTLSTRKAAAGGGQEQQQQQPSGIQFVPVGCSIGAAVLWTYAELFGHGTHDTHSSVPSDAGSFAGYIFVDQAPLQDRVPGFLGEQITWDESKAHTGCYDEASMQGAQRAWVHDTANAHRGLATECLGYRFRPGSAGGPEEGGQEEGDTTTAAEQARADEEFFTGISALCDPVWLARLLADHTRYDHRDAIREVVSEKPVLVMAGGLSGCFPRAGLLETARIVNEVREDGAEVSVFEDAGHWLFYERPARFNDEVVKFVDRVTKA